MRCPASRIRESTLLLPQRCPAPTQIRVRRCDVTKDRIAGIQARFLLPKIALRNADKACIGLAASAASRLVKRGRPSFGLGRISIHRLSASTVIGVQESFSSCLRAFLRIRTVPVTRSTSSRSSPTISLRRRPSSPASLRMA